MGATPPRGQRHGRLPRADVERPEPASVGSEVPDRSAVGVLAAPPGLRADRVEQRRNRRRAVAIVSVPAALVFVVVAGACVAGGLALIGVAIGVAAGIVVWLATWRGAPGVVLRALGVRQGTDAELQRADNLVDGLCATMGLEPPDIVVIDDPARQALALGRPGMPGVLVVTSGLLGALDPVALEGVLAHELVHLKRGDVAPATMAAVVFLPLARLLPAAGVVHALAGRGREFRTDRLAVAVTRYPPGLRDALVLMAEGPAPATPSRLAGGGAGQVTRWLWTVALPDPSAEASRVAEPGELDAPEVRIAALDEW